MDQEVIMATPPLLPPPCARCVVRLKLPPAWTPEEDARLQRLAKENGFRRWSRHRWRELRRGGFPAAATRKEQAPAMDADDMVESEMEESDQSPPPLELQHSLADALASSFGSCSLAHDHAMDPLAGSLALGFACMAGLCLHYRLGDRWKEIARAVHGRTSRIMKHRWRELRRGGFPAAAARKKQALHMVDDVVESEVEESADQSLPAPELQPSLADALVSSFGYCSLAHDHAKDPLAGSLSLGEGYALEHMPRTMCQPPKHTLQRGKPSTESAIAMRDRSPPGQQHHHDTKTLKRRPHEGCDAERRRRHPSKELDKVFTQSSLPREEGYLNSALRRVTTPEDEVTVGPKKLG
uniref:Myb-like domain-containing protein n=1 Tax=Oryza meridionalis TaxID=40149 RepID=A0A0E0EAJ6_9ORYZ